MIAIYGLIHFRCFYTFYRQCKHTGSIYRFRIRFYLFDYVKTKARTSRIKTPSRNLMYLRPVLTVKSLRRISFRRALEVQLQCRDRILKDGSGNTLLLLEHEPVYTVGLRSREYSKELEQDLVQLGAEFYRTDRGGLITFHGPGQLVAYPIIHLKQFQLGMKKYVNNLEETIIQTCKEFGVQAATSEHTGVWVGNDKIAAIGVHGSRFVTTHGIALNCNTDLSWFDHIVPCGIKDKGVTSLTKLLNRTVGIEQASEIFIKSFSSVFQCDVNR